MAVTKMGFEGQVFYGAAGSTGTTQVTDLSDVNYNIETDKGNTTIRGDGTSIPIETEDVTCRKVTIEFTALVRSSDTVVEALRVAAAAGTAIALRLKDYSSGKGFDGDMTLSMQHGKPLKGEQTIQFTATPTRSASRSPSLYV